MKNTKKKTRKRKHSKRIKKFLKKKKSRAIKRPEKDIKISLKKKKEEESVFSGTYQKLCKRQKQKLVEYRRSYYIKHSEHPLDHFVDILKILRQLDFLFLALILEI